MAPVNRERLGHGVRTGGASDGREAGKVADRDDVVLVAVDEEHRHLDLAHGPRGTDLGRGVPARAEEDVGGEPGKRPRDRARDRQARKAERLTGEPVRVGGR